MTFSRNRTNFNCFHIKLQLIKVDLDAQGSGIQVLRKFVNLGPIHDLCLVDPEKHGQTQVLTCSGGSKGGSLRMVSKGINEQV